MSDLKVGRIEQLTHTAGPWTCRGTAIYGGGCKIGEAPSASTHSESVVARDHARANAQLMAAAPTLLEALKRAVETIHAWHSMGHYAGEADEVWRLYQQSPEMQAINAAIAKAEGRT